MVLRMTPLAYCCHLFRADNRPSSYSVAELPHHTYSTLKAEVLATGSSGKSLHTYSAVVQLLSRVQLFVIPWIAARQASLSFTIAQFAQIHVH